MEIVSVIEVTYDYFRYENLVFIGTEDESNDFIKRSDFIFSDNVKSYGLEDKMKHEGGDNDSHLWVYKKNVVQSKQTLLEYQEKEQQLSEDIAKKLIGGVKQ